MRKKAASFSKDNFLFLLMASLVLIVSVVFLFEGKKREESGIAGIKRFSASKELQSKEFPSVPVLAVNIPFPIISAQAALVYDLDSSIPLYEKNPDGLFFPASTTKIVTALVAMDYYADEIVLQVDGRKSDGQDMGLVKGEKIIAKNLLEGLLVFSANDAAEVLASNYPEGKDGFVKAMNEKAKALNLTNTNFTNPSGFDDNNHYSSARDLIRVAIVAMQNPKFREIVSQKEKRVTSSDGKIVHKLVNTNQLLGKIEGVLGVKTGWTENARENLVTYLERDGNKVMIVLLGSQDRFGETKELIEWIFKNYQWREVKYP